MQISHDGPRAGHTRTLSHNHNVYTLYMRIRNYCQRSLVIGMALHACSSVVFISNHNTISDDRHASINYSAYCETARYWQDTTQHSRVSTTLPFITCNLLAARTACKTVHQPTPVVIKCDVVINTSERLISGVLFDLLAVCVLRPVWADRIFFVLLLLQLQAALATLFCVVIVSAETRTLMNI